MDLARLSIKRPVTVMMVAIAVVLFGFVSLPKLAVELYPELNLPVAVVVTSVEGSSPEEVENLVTKPIEEAVGTVSNLKTVSSNSAENASQVILEFNWGTDLDQALLDLRDKVDMVRGSLPDAAKAPRILKIDLNSFPIMMLALSGDYDPDTLKQIADDIVKPRLERVDGVASVGVTGGQSRIIEVILDPDKLSAYGITIDQVQQALAANNMSGTGGNVREGDGQVNIRIEGEFASVNSIGETPIMLPNTTIPLKNIATVHDTKEEVTQTAFLNGEPSIGLSITKASGGNTIEVADAVHKMIAEMEGLLPEGAQITTIYDTSIFIKDSIYTVGEHAILGGLIAIFVLLLFLNSLRSMLIVAIVIPISVIATFCLMFFTGQTINMISLAGLTLGLGSLVDFAVVILENIFRHRQMGKSMLQAARYGSREVGTAVMASALAQICVFLPIVFVEGIASELFGPLALTVVYSHLAALIASMTLVPMMSSRWLKQIPLHDEQEILATTGKKSKNPLVLFNIWFAKVAKRYGDLLRWSIGHRKTVLAGTILLFVVAIFLVPFVGADFIPKTDQGLITVSVTMPNGTVFEETEKVVDEVEAIVKETPEIKLLYKTAGGAGVGNMFANAMSHRGELSIELVPKEERSRSTEEIVEDLRSKLTGIIGAEIKVQEMDTSGMGSGAPITIRLRGDDLAVLEDLSNIIAEEIRQVEGTRNVESSLQDTNIELEVNIDTDKASQYGLTTGQILSNVRTAFHGQVVTRYRTGQDQIDVIVRMPKDFKQDINYLKDLRITTPSGGQVALNAIATLDYVETPQMISRYNQTRQVSVTSEVVGRDLNSVSIDISQRLQQLTLPEGYFIEFGGQDQEMMESFASLGLAILLSIALVYMVMASQFESLFSPFIIMFSIPPTFIGVVVGLLLTGQSLSVPALIGYILLVGIVVNNAIVLIDYVNTLRKRGVERNEALLQAGPVRLRPILMTSLTTIFAILPLAFGGGAGNELLAPMAVVVMFGLSFSTLITLILVPVVYTLFDDWGQKMRRFRWRKRKPAAEQIVEEI